MSDFPKDNGGQIVVEETGLSTCDEIGLGVDGEVEVTSEGTQGTDWKEKLN